MQPRRNGQPWPFRRRSGQRGASSWNPHVTGEWATATDAAAGSGWSAPGYSQAGKEMTIVGCLWDSNFESEILELLSKQE